MIKRNLVIDKTTLDNDVLLQHNIREGILTFSPPLPPFQYLGCRFCHTLLKPPSWEFCSFECERDHFEVYGVC